MPVLPVAPAAARPAAAPAPGRAPLGAAPPGFTAALERRAVAMPTATRTATPTPTPTAPATPAATAAVSALQRIERAQARLDGVLAAARAGQTFTAAELLALQAEAYRCTQTVDLAAKLVEQGAQAVKQALNTPL